ncbi:MAG: hypothetical protein DCF29_07970 [Alphaproteobacteria bacterium]|nr:MAG: hypothetical protein DCF29_07970 [Alphaproteobacteria bacterium]
MRRLSGLTADQCAVGLVAAARRLSVDPLEVFGGRQVRCATMVRQAVGVVVIGGAARSPGLTNAVARILAIRPIGLAPSSLKAEKMLAASQDAALAMFEAGFNPDAVNVGCEPKPRTARRRPAPAAAPHRPEPAPRRFTVETLPEPVRLKLERWLKAFNAGEMTLNLVKLRLMAAMTAAGLDEALCPLFPALQRAAKVLRQKAAEVAKLGAAVAAAPPVAALPPAPVVKIAAYAELAKRVEAMEAQAAIPTRRPVDDAPAPQRMPDIIYGDTQAKPLDLGAADGRLVAACVAQGGFPRAVEIKPGVTVWADLSDKPWRFRP